MLAHHPSQLSKAVTGETRSDLGPYMHSTTEAAPSTPTSEGTELSSRSGVRVYSDRGKRIGPVFSSVEKAQDFLSRN